MLQLGLPRDNAAGSEKQTEALGTLTLKAAPRGTVLNGQRARPVKGGDQAAKPQRVEEPSGAGTAVPPRPGLRAARGCQELHRAGQPHARLPGGRAARLLS